MANFKIQLNMELPIAKHETSIARSVKNYANTIVIGETGSGKTTQIPLIILKELQRNGLTDKFKVAITQPRRIAAVSVSKYTAEHIGEEIGEHVGYKIRFEDVTSARTILNFMTEGILLREMQSDPLLTGYAYIMVDEAHERNLNTDFILGLLKEVQKKRHQEKYIPLKVIVTSATLQKEKFEEFLSHNTNETLKSIEIPGRMFPVKRYYMEEDPDDFKKAAARKVLEISKRREDGDVLIFMPGKGEIEDTSAYIESLKHQYKLNLRVIPIHSELPIEEQEKIFKPTKERKVVIATNIAETSITVPNVAHVVDSGLIKEMEFNPRIGVKSLVLKNHALKGLEQRMGRAGRTRPGEYHALYSKKSLKGRQEFQTPEIQRSGLNEVVLKMKALGIKDILNFDFIDKPSKPLMKNAVRELQEISALNKEGEITELGMFFVQFPLEPKIANLLHISRQYNCLEPMIIIAAFLELKPIFVNLTDEFLITYIKKQNLPITEENIRSEFEKAISAYNSLQSEYSDFETILNIWKEWEKNEFNPEWAEANYLSIDTLSLAKEAVEQIAEILRDNNIYVGEITFKNIPFTQINRVLLKAFRYNVIYWHPYLGYKQMFGTMDKIQFHWMSSLKTKKVEFAISYEIIEIKRMGEKPKNSARVLAEIPKQLLLNEIPQAKQKIKKRKSFRRVRKFRKRRH